MQPAQLVVRVLDQRHRHAAQRVLHLRQPLRVVVGVLGDLRKCGFPACRMRMAHHGRLAREGVDRRRHVVPAQQVALHSLRHAALHVVAVHQVDIAIAPFGTQACARKVARRVGLSQKGGQRRETNQGNVGIGVIVVYKLYFSTSSSEVT